MNRWLVLWAIGCTGGKSGGETPVEGVASTTFTLPPPGTTPTAPETASRPSFACWADVALDRGRDGTVDGVGFDGYDEQNPTFLLYGDRDLNGNQLLDYIDTYERDAAGNELAQVRDRSGAFTSTSSWDANGKILSYTYDASSDGRLDFSYLATWDPNGQLLHYEEDADGDGDVDYQYDYVRTPEGFRDAADVDVDGDGVYDDHYTYLRDDVDREVQIVSDYGTDGITDRLVTYTYSDPVRRVGDGAIDEGAEGEIDTVLAFEYDSDGHELYYATDGSPPDGAWEEERSASYDADGRVTATSTVDHQTPYEIRETFAYDALGRTIREGLWFEYYGDLIQDDETTYTFGGSCP